MKKYLLIVFISLTSILEAQNLYGVTENSTGTLTHLSLINPVTGSVNLISSTGITSSPSQSNSALDPINKKYFFVSNMSYDTLNVISLATGNLMNQNKLSNSGAYQVGSIEFNCSDTTLYAISTATSNYLSYLSKINPVTGSVSTISSTGFKNDPFASTLDPIKNRFYGISVNDTILTVDLKFGNVICKKRLSTFGTYGIASIEYNSSDTTLYAIASINTNQLDFLAKINPFTGSVTILSTTGFGQNVCTGMSTIDPVGKKYFFNSCNDSIYTVDVITGNLAYKARFSNYSTAPIWTLDFEQQVCSSPLNTQEVGYLNIKMSVFPNPNNGSFKIQIDNEIENGELILINSLGQEVHKQKIFAETTNVNTSGLSTGLYNYLLSESKQIIGAGKLEIEK